MTLRHLVVLAACGGWLSSFALVGATTGQSSVTQGPVTPETLPKGPGLTILEASCTSCHDLEEVTKFAGFYTRAEWADIVKTMIEYGAKVESKDVEVLVDYLDKHLGKRP